MLLNDSDIFAYDSRLCVASKINEGIQVEARHEGIIEEAKESGVLEGLDKIEPQIQQLSSQFMLEVSRLCAELIKKRLRKRDQHLYDHVGDRFHVFELYQIYELVLEMIFKER